jgi:hypothetical protein
MDVDMRFQRHDQKQQRDLDDLVVVIQGYPQCGLSRERQVLVQYGAELPENTPVTSEQLACFMLPIH